jgi:2-polyprenyl-6-hydroxyphenyl methylase/3-demethylubiquinone-9 3-methyltransferase
MNKTYYAKKLNAERLRRVYEIAGPRVCQYLQAEIDHLAGFVQPGDKILELGCGFGRVLAPLARIAGQGWGVDNSPESVDQGRISRSELVSDGCRQFGFR